MMHRVLQFTLLTVAVVLDSRTDAATTAAVKFCGRQLSEIMTRVCHAYNSPSWDVPTVVEQPGSTRRRRRHVGIADECCIIGCTWEQLSEYCSISAYSESPLEEMEGHIISDRSAEQQAKATAASSAPSAGLVKSVARAAPVVGTVSPLLTWGRTLNTDHLAYVVYT